MGVILNTHVAEADTSTSDSLFNDQPTKTSFRGPGIVIAIAILALLTIFISVLFVAIILRRHRERNHTHRVSRNNMFPLTMSTLRHNASQEHMLLAKESCSTFTTASRMEDGKMDDDMPLPPPPSYSEINGPNGGVRSESGVSWVTEVEELPRRPARAQRFWGMRRL